MEKLFTYNPHLFLLCLLLATPCATLFCQAAEETDDRGFYPPLQLEDEIASPVGIKKKYVPKSVYYNIKGRKVTIRSLVKRELIIEKTYRLKVQNETPPPFVKEIYWYDKKKRQLRKTKKFDPKKGYLLHGRYEKKIRKTKQILQTGFFFKGAKHGRWVTWTKNNTLINKEYFFKGWHADSNITYYDIKREKLREIIPVRYGERHGEYLAFYQNGNLAAKGLYEHDKKIGVWESYHPTLLGGKRSLVKRMIQYPENAFDETLKPYILREWNPEGDLLYDRVKYLKSLR